METAIIVAAIPILALISFVQGEGAGDNWAEGGERVHHLQMWAIDGDVRRGGGVSC